MKDTFEKMMSGNETIRCNKGPLASYTEKRTNQCWTCHDEIHKDNQVCARYDCPKTQKILACGRAKAIAKIYEKIPAKEQKMFIKHIVKTWKTL